MNARKQWDDGALAELHDADMEARKRPCPTCGALIDELCSNPKNAGKPYGKPISHLARMKGGTV